jgi:putative transposase
VTHRGNDRERTFFDDPDRRPFLELAGVMVWRHAVQAHAYVLMDNQYHLLVGTPLGNLSVAVGAVEEVPEFLSQLEQSKGFGP